MTPATVPPVTVDRALARRLQRAAERIEASTTERDRLIVEALDAGGSLREVAALVGLTGPGVMKIRDRMRTAAMADELRTEHGIEDSPDGYVIADDPPPKRHPIRPASQETGR